MELCQAEAQIFSTQKKFYNQKGENLAYCEIFGAWINLKTRKLSNLPNELLALTKAFPKSKNYKILTKEDTRFHGRKNCFRIITCISDL